MPNDVPAPVAPASPETTGALLVVFGDRCDAAQAHRLIEDAIGRPPARTRDYAGRLTSLSTELHAAGAALFDEFGLAVIDPQRCGVAAVAIESLAARDDVLFVRPEYRVQASGGWLCRLFGLSRAPAQDRAAPTVDGASAPAPAPSPAPGPAPAAETGAATETDAETETGAETETWGLRAIGADRTPLTGAGVKVAILDTGFAFDHPDFAGRAIVAESFVFDETAEDGQGHGAHVAGTAVGPAAPTGAPRYGVAPEAELYVAKVLSDNGSGREGDILAGILWALENRCEVVSLSLGRRPLPGDSSGDYDRIGQIALDQGSLLIAAAGNESERRLGRIAPVGAPANARSILAVGAVDEALAIASFSNGGLVADGGAVDLCAPGVNILSIAPPPALRATLSGSSMATPHVAGVAALLAQSDPGLRGQALWDALTRSARDIGLAARDGGAGLVQAPTSDPARDPARDPTRGGAS